MLSGSEASDLAMRSQGYLDASLMLRCRSA